MSTGNYFTQHSGVLLQRSWTPKT